MIGGFERLGEKAGLAAVNIVRRSESVIEANIKRQFTGAHKPGEPTTSPPGSPPDVVTGTLRRSVVSTRPVRRGFEASGSVYPSAVYSRIQELGGGALPARPYVQPGYDESMDDVRRIAFEEWGRI